MTFANHSGCVAGANKGGRRPDVARDDVGRAQIGLGDELGARFESWVAPGNQHSLQARSVASRP